MSKIETIFQNKWITIKSFSDNELGVEDYFFSHDTRSGGCSVAILPYRKWNSSMADIWDKEFLLKGDIIPAWHEKIILCSITGAVEHDTPEETAIVELDEEVGYTVEKDELISLGTCFGNKASDTVNYLYSVDLSNKIPHEPKGDGYENLLGNESHWVRHLNKVQDPLVSIMYMRLRTYFLQKDI